MSTLVASALQRLFFRSAASRRLEKAVARNRTAKGTRQPDFTDTRPGMIYRSEAFAEDLHPMHRVA